MKAIAIWASRNQKKAIILIVVFEVLKCSIGFNIGHNFLPLLSSAFIELAVLCVVFLITFVQTNYQYQSNTLSKATQRRFRFRNTGLMFLSSLFLSILLGNHFKELDYSLNSVLVVNAAVVTTADSMQTAATDNVTAEKKITKKLKHFIFAKKTTDDDPHSNRRIGYVLLFLLSLLLAGGSLVLTCGLACGGWAIFAVLGCLATLGILSGGIYFLIKAFQSPVRPNELMTKQEKKKEGRKFLIIWAIVSGIVGLATVVLSQQ